MNFEDYDEKDLVANFIFTLAAIAMGGCLLTLLVMIIPFGKLFS